MRPFAAPLLVVLVFLSATATTTTIRHPRRLAFHPLDYPLQDQDNTFRPSPVIYVEVPSAPISTNLGVLVRDLQHARALPPSITSENVDRSIRTLVRILEALRRHQHGEPPPRIAPPPPQKYRYAVLRPRVKIRPKVKFEDSSPSGGTPGVPGVDYPALFEVPSTSFKCENQRYKGFFGDTETRCQAWHYCDLNGGQASFLCPNGTLFSQTRLTCDWWYNVDCDGPSTHQQYVLNERLYKYIIPLTPKFPEDFKGPAVDTYLKAKYEEMEEQLQRQKSKGKSGNSQSDSSDQESDEITTTESDNVTEINTTASPQLL